MYATLCYAITLDSSWHKMDKTHHDIKLYIWLFTILFQSSKATLFSFRNPIQDDNKYLKNPLSHLAGGEKGGKGTQFLRLNMRSLRYKKVGTSCEGWRSLAAQGGRPEVPKGTIARVPTCLNRLIVCPKLDYGLITLPWPFVSSRAARIHPGGFEEDRIARHSGVADA